MNLPNLSSPSFREIVPALHQVLSRHWGVKENMLLGLLLDGTDNCDVHQLHRLFVTSFILWSRGKQGCRCRVWDL